MLPIGNYHAPCDLAEESELVKSIATGQLQPLSGKAVADYIGKYVLDLVNGNDNPDKLDALIENANNTK